MRLPTVSPQTRQQRKRLSGIVFRFLLRYLLMALAAYVIFISFSREALRVFWACSCRCGHVCEAAYEA